jgi:hypothetical protein
MLVTEQGDNAGEETTASPLSVALPEPARNGNTWANVLERKGKGRGRVEVRGEAPASRTLPDPSAQSQSSKRKGKDPLRATRRRLKKTSAVIVNGPGNYGEAMSLLKQKINLAELGIEGVRARRAFDGGLVIEIPGERVEEKAGRFAESMRSVLGSAEGLGDVWVSVPTQRSSLRLCGIEDSTTEEEIKNSVAEAGGCSPSDMSIGRWTSVPGRLRRVVVQCPSRAVVRIAKAGGKIQINGDGSRFVRYYWKRPPFCTIGAI